MGFTNLEKRKRVKEKKRYRRRRKGGNDRLKGNKGGRVWGGD